MAIGISYNLLSLCMHQLYLLSVWFYLFSLWYLKGNIYGNRPDGNWQESKRTQFRSEMGTLTHYIIDSFHSCSLECWIPCSPAKLPVSVDISWSLYTYVEFQMVCVLGGVVGWWRGARGPLPMGGEGSTGPGPWIIYSIWAVVRIKTSTR